MLVLADEGVLKTPVNGSLVSPMIEVVNRGRSALVVTLTWEVGTGQVVGTL